MTAPETLARIETACAELIRDAEAVSFTSVAAQGSDQPNDSLQRREPTSCRRREPSSQS